jgi:hypothetical protein
MEQLALPIDTPALPRCGRIAYWVGDDEKVDFPLYDPSKIQGHIAEAIRKGAEVVAVQYRERWFVCYPHRIQLYVRFPAAYRVDAWDPGAKGVTPQDMDLYNLVTPETGDPC